jgi:hypothetical protein
MMSGINGGLPKSKTGHRSATKTSFQGSRTRLMSRRILSGADDSPHRRAGFTLNPTDLNDDGTGSCSAKLLLLLAGSDREVVLTPADVEVEEVVLRDHADGPRGGG